MTTNITMLAPTCSKCGGVVWAGDVVDKQGGPHALCSDPALLRHVRRLRLTGDGQVAFGYVANDGDTVWL